MEVEQSVASPRETLLQENSVIICQPQDRRCVSHFSPARSMTLQHTLDRYSLDLRSNLHGWRQAYTTVERKNSRNKTHLKTFSAFKLFAVERRLTRRMRICILQLKL